jgi:hypothetical protein
MQGCRGMAKYLLKGLVSDLLAPIELIATNLIPLYPSAASSIETIASTSQVFCIFPRLPRSIPSVPARDSAFVRINCCGRCKERVVCVYSIEGYVSGTSPFSHSEVRSRGSTARVSS